LPTKDQIGKELVNVTVKQLDNWIYKELEKLKYGNFPVCLNFDDKTLYVSGFFIKTIKSNMHKVYNNEKIIHIFYSKYAAILYSLLSYLKYTKTADNILKHDMEVAKNYDDIQYYKRMITNGVAKDNIFILEDKLLESQHRYKFKVEELEKIITNAKYMKVWEKLK
jgi:hypothetical protein